MIAPLARAALVALSMAAAGCFGGGSLNCEDPAQYGSAASVPPVRVPDGLSVPDETQSLQIPPGEPYVVTDPETLTECLEDPPDFFEDDA